MSDLLLYSFAQLLDDIEGIRKSSANRLRILTASDADTDGVVRGFGLDESNYSVKALRNLQDGVDGMEKEVVKALQKIMKDHPLGSWVKAQKGVGEKQAARLLSAIGDPYMRPETEIVDDDDNVIEVRPGGPRTVSQLWAYAGLHVGDDGVAVRRKKGVQSNWKTEIKTRAYLVATSCIKQMDSPYRKIYDKRRAHTATTNPTWTDGHSHNDALRIVSKALLRDMWIESKRLHDEAQTSSD